MNTVNDPRDECERIIPPEVAFRYRSRFGGEIILGQEIRNFNTTDKPAELVNIGPTLVNNDKTIAVIKRGTFLEDFIAWATEGWGHSNHKDGIDKSSYRDARAHARKLRRNGVPYTDIPDIIKEIWGERIGELVAGLRGTEYYLSIPGEEE